jgi:hypothetical protein
MWLSKPDFLKVECHPSLKPLTFFGCLNLLCLYCFLVLFSLHFFLSFITIICILIYSLSHTFFLCQTKMFFFLGPALNESCYLCVHFIADPSKSGYLSLLLQISLWRRIYNDRNQLIAVIHFQPALTYQMCHVRANSSGLDISKKNNQSFSFIQFLIQRW